ncbi:MAG: hypothetical protein K2J82_07820 [Muribaculaceae bacterium]|nr:hypothetical protein [Muribaculaceae bacterium]
MKKFDVASLCRHCNGDGKFPCLEISAAGSVTSFFFIFMVKIIDNQIHIIIDSSLSSKEDLVNFIDAMFWYISHIDQDCFCEEDNFYMCELLRSMVHSDSTLFQNAQFPGSSNTI